MVEQLVERGGIFSSPSGPAPKNIHTVCTFCTPILQNNFNLSSNHASLVLSSAGDGVRLRIRGPCVPKQSPKQSIVGAGRPRKAATASDRFCVAGAIGPVTFMDGSPQLPDRRRRFCPGRLRPPHPHGIVNHRDGDSRPSPHFSFPLSHYAMTGFVFSAQENGILRYVCG